MKINGRGLCYFGLVALAVSARLLPHPPNFTPVGALGLYTGAYASRWTDWLVPVIALLISDMVIGFYAPVAMLMVYLGFIGSMAMGKWLLSRKRGVVNISTACFASALLFFVCSNLGVWLSGTLYPMTLDGLYACYLAALPFFGNTLAANLVYGAVMFGLFEYLSGVISGTRVPRTA